MNSKTEQVVALKNDGWSLRNIAKELGLSVFTVRSILSKQPQPEPSLVDTTINSYPSDVIPKNEVRSLLSGILTKHSDEQTRSAKRQFVNRLNRLVKEWLDNSNDCEWSLEDLQDYRDSASRLKMDVINFCEILEMPFQGLAIYHNASELKRYFIDCLRDESEVTFDLEEGFYDVVESLKVESFDDAHTGVDLLAEEEDDDEDEEEDDD